MRSEASRATVRQTRSLAGRVTAVPPAPGPVLHPTSVISAATGAMAENTRLVLFDERPAAVRPAMIMIDQDRARNGIEREASEDAPWLTGGGILTAPSSHVAGLQFADALSFGIGRRFRRAEQFEDDTASGLDLASLGPIAALNGRSRMVLADWPGDTRDQSSSPVSSFQRPASTSVNPAG